MKKILGATRKAIKDYNMIESGDKIAVGLSGGKDSFALLTILQDIQKHSKFPFEIMAIHINPGWDNYDTSLLLNFCTKNNIPYVEIPSNIKNIVFDIRKEKNPCSLCANLRRGMLNSAAVTNNCNKIALAHNQDDAIETLLLNLFYVGNINCFPPVSYMDRSDLTLIRPFVYVPELCIEAFVNKYNIPVINKACPLDGYSKRSEIKELISSLEEKIPHIKSHLSGAIKRKNINGWKI